jgi:hypothetical protein
VLDACSRVCRVARRRFLARLGVARLH